MNNLSKNISVEALKKKVLLGHDITKEEAIFIYNSDIDEISKAADEIRRKYCGNDFDMCTIINARSGRCSENCKFCAQSSFYDTNVETYPLLETEKIVEGAKYNEERGVKRYSLVTSGKNVTDKETEQIEETLKVLDKETSISICASLGLLNEAQYRRLKESGLTRVHNNLESSENFFKNVCTSHTFEDKVKAIKEAQKAGLNVCSGGIIGMGESIEDRIDMALKLRELGIKSVPVNLLNPIKGTPFELNKIVSADEFIRVISTYRFILKDAIIRLAGGRALLSDKGKRAFTSGANACITGDMLTTSGMTIKEDQDMVKSLGYEIKLHE